jgi:5-formyltetrahydrofolate cyclo-ligase
MTEKQTLRRELTEQIAALPDEYITASDNEIFERVIALPEFRRATTIFAYYSVKREPDTHRIIDCALSLGKTVALPESLPQGVMVARRVTADDISKLQPGRMGIPSPPGDAEEIAPSDFDLIIVPAVTFDREGFRLGYGGGYYDRYLPKTTAFTVGLARERILRESVPREAHDVSARCLVTDANIRRF